MIAPRQQNRTRYLDLSEFVNIRLSTVSVGYLSFYGLFLVLLIGTNILFFMERRTNLARLVLRKQCFWPDSGSRDYFVMIENIFRLDLRR